MNVLVTGGTGHLGRPLVARLTEDGHRVRVLGRRPSREPGVEWIQGDLAYGDGIREAVTGMDTLIHAATDSPAARRGSVRPLDLVRTPTGVDIGGTKMLLDAAEREGIERFIHVSIVGLEEGTLPYMRVKLAAERLVENSAVPASIMRATGFYWLLDRMLTKMSRRKIVPVPSNVRTVPVDEHDFAAEIAASVTDGNIGRSQDLIGPELLSMEELLTEHLAVRGIARRLVPVPLPPPMKRAFEWGNTSTGGRRGETTWGEWLERHYAVIAAG